MDVGTTSRLFTVKSVSESTDEHGYHDVVLEFRPSIWHAKCKPTDRPAVGAELSIFYREGELDFAFEGLLSVSKAA